MLWQVRRGLIAGRGALDAAPAAPGGSGSAWGDHGTNVALSTTTIADDTANGTADSFSSVRGTQAHSSGKWYFEVKALTAPAAPLFLIGIMDDTTASGAAMNDTPSAIPNSTANSIFNGNTQGNGSWNGTNIGSGWSLADGDVMAYAFDADNNFGYLGLAHVGDPSITWFLSGDPTSGATGTGAVGNGITGNARPAISIYNVTVGGVFKLVTDASSLTYTLPTGYSAWG